EPFCPREPGNFLYPEERLPHDVGLVDKRTPAVNTDAADYFLHQQIHLRGRQHYLHLRGLSRTKSEAESSGDILSEPTAELRLDEIEIHLIGNSPRGAKSV